MTSAEELASLAVFAGVPTDDLVDLAAHVTSLRVRRGDVLMRQGEQAESFLIVASGDVDVRHTGDDGDTTVAHLAAGFIVGELALLRHAARSATVVAAGDVVGYIGREDAFRHLLENRDIASKLVRTARQRLAACVTPIPIEARDGTELMLRPVLPGDTERIIRGHVQLSPESLYRRFLSVRRPTETVLAYLFEVDYVDHFVWVATDGVDGPVVADARFVRDPADPAVAEIAFTVADLYQGRGIGTVLFAALAIAARVDGIARFQARVLSDNLPARALLDRLDAPWVHEEPGVVAATIDVPAPHELGVELRHANEIRAVARQVIEAFD